jgi:hypothetical protein
MDNRDSIGSLYHDTSFNTGFTSINQSRHKHSAAGSAFGSYYGNARSEYSRYDSPTQAGTRTEYMSRNGGGGHMRMNSPKVNNFTLGSGMSRGGFKSPQSNVLGKLNFSKGTMSTVS